MLVKLDDNVAENVGCVVRAAHGVQHVPVDLPAGGDIRQPQRVSSWLMGELLSCIGESGQKQLTMSETQRAIVREALGKNPSAPALRFQELDKRFVESE